LLLVVIIKEYKNKSQMANMKLLLLFSIILFINEQLFCQEEFLGDKNGLSLSYQNILGMNTNAVNFCKYFKSGYIGGIGIEKVGSVLAPNISLILCPDFNDKTSTLDSFFGIYYSYVENDHLLGCGYGFAEYFLMKQIFRFH
jgi:hypothetical protein